MRSVLLSSVILTVLLPTHAAPARERDGEPEDPPSQSACVQSLEKCGASVQIGGDGRVLGIGMTPSATDAHLAPLQHLTDVEQLYVGSPKVADVGLKSVQRLKNLKTLNLNGTGVTDAGMTRLAQLARLRSLYLDGTDIADAGLAHLAGLKELRVLSLGGTRVTDDGLQAVRKMTRLGVLNILDTNVTADGLLHLRMEMPNLDISSNCSSESQFAREKLKQFGALLESEDDCVTSVRIKTQQAVEEGLRLLWGLPALKRLSLFGVTLTSEHITILTRLEDLKNLEVVVHEKIAHKDFRRLRQAMSGANIAGWYVKPPSDQSAVGGTKTVSLRASWPDVSRRYWGLPRLSEDFMFDCTYFPGNRGTESIPVVLLHDLNGSRRAFDPLAKKLQSHGCAVVVPEMWPKAARSRLPDLTDGDESARRARVPYGPFFALGFAQLEAITTFLVDEHNSGALNVSLLCLVADGRTGVVATDWTAYWARDPPVDRIFDENVFDIRAVVALSPSMLRGHRGPYLLPRTDTLSYIPTMLVVGAQSEDSLRAAKIVHASLKRPYHRPNGRPTEASSSSNESANPNLSLLSVASSKQGTALVSEHPTAAQQVVDFIDKSVEDAKKNSSWKVRVTSRLESAFESK